MEKSSVCGVSGDLPANIGFHIPKHRDGVYRTLADYYIDPRTQTVYREKQGRACQIFLGSPRAFQISKISDEDKRKTRELIEKHKLVVFVHAPYVVNLCRECDNRETGMHKSRAVLLKYIHASSELGVKGVVFHVGKRLTMEKERALCNFRENVHTILESLDALNKTKLILETPAGQGTEILTTPSGFAGFCSETLEKFPGGFGVCVDTCHVFACGYDPCEYMREMDRAHLPVDLIHFNDSRKGKGSRVDRHILPGDSDGKIGLQTLLDLYAAFPHIPCVIEA
jgi:deoxyribonuclease-4